MSSSRNPDSDASPASFTNKLKTISKRRFTNSFANTLIKSFVTDYLSAYKYKPEHIRYVNQIIHSLFLLAGGHSYRSVAIRPVAIYLLTNYCGIEESKANDIVTYATLTQMIVSALRNSNNVTKTTATISVSMGANMFGGTVARFVHELLNNGFFGNKNARSYVAKSDVAEAVDGLKLSDEYELPSP